MTKFLPIVLLAAACGYSSKDNELVGQVKKVKSMTPIICGDYYKADVSLGFLRDGVGSLSKEDVEVEVPSQHVQFFKEAAESGKIVKVSYDVRRLVICVPDHIVTNVEYLK